MIETRIDALVAAAADGVAFEGLRVQRRDDGFRFTIGSDTHTGVEQADVRALAREHEAVVAEWYHWTQVAPSAEDKSAFLRWLEGADDREPPTRRQTLETGVDTTWGQLQLSVRLVDDQREYSIRHVDDVGRPTAELDRHDDPLDARDLRTRDDTGSYRPLSTAPTLQTGWIFPSLGPTALVEAVEHVYPATVANWYRERTDHLDVSHWDETAGRQTGIYDLVDDLPREGIEALAAACCTDDVCLKRRQWDATEGDRLDAPRGAGEFPCREPCSLVIAAAREFTKTERESTSGSGLRPRERAQFERIVDAIAAGEIDDVDAGAVTDPANRLRVRYLRERLLASDRWDTVAEQVAGSGDSTAAGHEEVQRNQDPTDDGERSQ